MLVWWLLNKPRSGSLPKAILLLLAFCCSSLADAEVIRDYRGLVPGMAFDAFLAQSNALGCSESAQTFGVKVECAECDLRQQNGFCLNYDYQSSSTMLFGKPVKSIAYVQRSDGRSKITVYTFEADGRYIGEALAAHHGSTYQGPGQLMVWHWSGGKTWWGGETTLHILRDAPL